MILSFMKNKFRTNNKVKIIIHKINKIIKIVTIIDDINIEMLIN